MKKLLVIVEWIDICSFDSEVADREHTQARFLNFGILWKKFKNQYGNEIYRIVHRVDMNRSGKGMEDDFTDIPKDVIISIKKVEKITFK